MVLGALDAQFAPGRRQRPVNHPVHQGAHRQRRIGGDEGAQTALQPELTAPMTDAVAEAAEDPGDVLARVNDTWTATYDRASHARLPVHSSTPAITAAGSGSC